MAVDVENHLTRQPQPESAGESSGSNIVIVEDDPDHAAALARIIKLLRPASRVHIAADGLSAGLLLGNIVPCVAFVDIELPTADGIEVIRRVRAVTGLRDIQFVVVSGHLSEDRIETLTKLGVKYILPKPLDPHRIRRALADLLSPKMGPPAVDITGRVAAEEAARQSQKMEALGQLAVGVAHDINNILTVILSFGSFLLDSLPPGDERHDDVQEVLNAADRAAGLTRQLLTFSRQQVPHRGPTDLNRNLTQLGQLLSRTVGDNIELVVSAAARPAVVAIDPVQFDQVVLNLALNARDAMPEGGRLHIALEQCPPEEGAPGLVRLTVTDTGAGIDDRTQQRIFEPFFTTKAVGQGTGLGLATCFGIVAAAEGTILVKSAIGCGTTFEVVFPCAGDEIVLHQAEPPGPFGHHTGTVLLAEDEPALRKVMVRVLESAGFTVHAAIDGAEAVEMLDRLGSELDAVLTDVVMPGCSGFEVADHARKAAPLAAIVLTSGYVDAETRRGRPVDLPILWKPAPPREVVRAVAHAVALGRSRRDALGGRESTTRASAIVLVLDDDAAARNAITRVLAAGGHQVHAVDTVDKARMFLEDNSEPLAVLCDLGLASGSGADLVNWIDQHLPGLTARTFLLTGGATDAEGFKAVDDGKWPVLRKPIEPRGLLSALQPLRDGLGASSFPTLGPVPAEPPSVHADSEPTPPTPTGRVLLVEDDAAVVGAVQRILASAGYDLVTAGSLSEAVAALQANEFDVLLLDLGLPDGSGFALLRCRVGTRASRWSS